MGFVNVDMRNFDGYGDFGRSRFRRITHAISAPIKAVTKIVAAPVKMVVKPLSKITTPLLKPLTKIPILGMGIAAVGGKTGLLKMKPAVITDEASGQPTTVYQDENGNYITESEYNRLSAEAAAQEATPPTPPANWRNLPAMTKYRLEMQAWRERMGLPQPVIKSTKDMFAPRTVVDNLPQGMPSSPGPTAAAMQQQSPTSYVEKAVAIRNGSKANQQAMQDELPDLETAPPSAEPQNIDWASPFLSKEHLQGEIQVDTFGRYPVRRRRQISLGERRSDMITSLRRGRGLALGRRFNGGIEFTSGNRPLQYGPINFKGYGLDDMGDPGLVSEAPAKSGNWLDTLTNIAAKGKQTIEQARAAKRSIQDIARSNRASARPQVPALPGAPMPRQNTIMGMPAMAVYTGAGLLLAGSVAYFAFKKK
jgi:hypothetical protein